MEDSVHKLKCYNMEVFAVNEYSDPENPRYPDQHVREVFRKENESIAAKIGKAQEVVKEACPVLMENRNTGKES